MNLRPGGYGFSRPILWALMLALCPSLFPAATCSPLAQADVVIDWNRHASDVLVNDTLYQNPGMASRTLAMVNLAMYDSINGISARHQPFYGFAAGPTNASVEAAAIESAYRVLSSVYPSQQTFLDTKRTMGLAAIPDGANKTAGISYGQSVANQIITDRAHDGFDTMVNYVPQGGPGHWEPDPLNDGQMAWGPAWGTLRPFAISDTPSYMPPPMPDLASQAYADSFNEVKSLGAVQSVTRTVDQTELALFWAYDRLGMGTPLRLYNGVLQTVATDQGNDLWDNARLFASATLSMADAGVVAWDSKFTYDLWRPISGVRRADEDGNPLTIADPTWVPLGAPGGIGPNGEIINDFTPAFPTYVSGHASFGGALFQALTDFYGTDEITFSATSDELPGVTRTFERFSDAMAENGRSRIYLGIHFDFDDLEGRILGSNVASFVTDTHFQPVPEPSSCMLLSVTALAWLRRRRSAMPSR